MPAAIDPADAARKEAAKQALQPPAMPAEEQALADTVARQAIRPDVQAAPESEATGLELPKGFVRARVLRKGHNKIFTGQIDGTNPDAEAKFGKFKFGDVIPIEGRVALAQEENGHVEVLGPYRRSLGLPEEE